MLLGGRPFFMLLVSATAVRCSLENPQLPSAASYDIKGILFAHYVIHFIQHTKNEDNIQTHHCMKTRRAS